MRALAVFFAALIIAAVPADADINFLRNPHRDVEKAIGVKLEKDQVELVDYVMTYYAFKYGRTKDKTEGDQALASGKLGAAIRAMSAEEYAHAVEKAALIAASKTARTILKLGKYGEKTLKALIVIAEDAARDLDKYIQEKSIEFDARH